MTGNSATRPFVSIGMPVYNGERYIRQALDSLLAQTFTDYEIVVSDNASTDATGAICQEYEKKDSRIRYVRQPENLGAARNFKFVLDQATAGYFMWAACDDVRSPDFIEINLRFLQSHPDFVASTCPVRFEGETFDEWRMGDGSLASQPWERMAGVLPGHLHANGRFYSLMRRDAIKNCPVVDQHFLGSDWCVIIHLASQGKLNRAAEGSIVLGKNGVSGSRDIFRVYRNRWLDFFLPFNRLGKFTWSLTEGLSAPAKLRIFLRLVMVNISGFYAQCYVWLRRKRS